MTLINAMRTDVPLIGPDDELAGAAKRFGETGCCSLPVIEDGRLVGLLEALDVAARVAGGEVDLNHARVRLLMNPEPVTCRPETSLGQALNLMMRERLNTLCISEPGPRLVGVIDLVGLLIAADTPSSAGPEPEWNQRVRGEAG